MEGFNCRYGRFPDGGQAFKHWGGEEAAETYFESNFLEMIREKLRQHYRNVGVLEGWKYKVDHVTGITLHMEPKKTSQGEGKKGKKGQHVTLREWKDFTPA